MIRLLLLAALCGSADLDRDHDLLGRLITGAGHEVSLGARPDSPRARVTLWSGGQCRSEFLLSRPDGETVSGRIDWRYGDNVSSEISQYGAKVLIEGGISPAETVPLLEFTFAGEDDAIAAFQAFRNLRAACRPDA